MDSKLIDLVGEKLEPKRFPASGPRCAVYFTGGFITVVIAVAVTVWTVFCSQPQSSSIPAVETQKLCIWAWERNEDLSFIDPAQTSVAYYAGHIYLRGENLMFRPRTQKLSVPSTTTLIPVFRIETLRGSSSSGEASASAPPDGIAKYVARTVCQNFQTIVQEHSQIAAPHMVQIDFDATLDERSLYHAILKELRAQLPSGTKISITCLGSWLLGDKWLREGETDEVVAMLFSIGADSTNILNRISREPLNPGTSAVVSLGISANEPETNFLILNSNLVSKSHVTYLFSSHAWTKHQFQLLSKEVSQR